MKYSIVWCEVKKTGEYNGKPWKITSMTLKDEAGIIIEGVDTFDTVLNGITMEGTIEEKGQYKNFKSTPVAPKTVSGTTYRAKQINDVMEKKAEYISTAQGNKELGIKVSSTMNKAIDLAIAEGSPTDERILYWRKWIWEHWDAEEKDFNPF